MPIPPLQLRPAAEVDLGACRGLLPDAFPVSGRPAECVVAERGGRIVGAGAMAWVPNGFPVLVHVVPEARRQGVGRALLQAQRDTARGETAGVRGWGPVMEGSDAALFLQACGFGVRQRLHVFEADPAQLGAAMTALLARMVPRIPPGTVLVAPEQAPAAALGRLLASEFAVRQRLDAALAGAAPGGWDQKLSLALLVDGTVAGVVLARRHGPVLEVDFNVVAPAWRGSWANVMLVEGVLRRGRAAGLDRLRFLAEPHVRDTVNLARRAGAVRRADQLVMTLSFQER